MSGYQITKSIIDYTSTQSTLSQAPPHKRHFSYKGTFQRPRGSIQRSVDTKTPKTERLPVHASCYSEHNKAYSATGRNLSTGAHTHAHRKAHTNAIMSRLSTKKLFVSFCASNLSTRRLEHPTPALQLSYSHTNK